MDGGVQELGVTVPEQLEQVLIHLLRNVRQTTAGIRSRPAARVDSSARPALGKVVFEVSDNGPGIVEEVLDQVFVAALPHTILSGLIHRHTTCTLTCTYWRC